MGHRPDQTDIEIMQILNKGRATPGYITERVDVSRVTVTRHLKVLTAADLIRDLGNALYEITEEGKEYVEEN